MTTRRYRLMLYGVIVTWIEWIIYSFYCNGMNIYDGW